MPGKPEPFFRLRTQLYQLLLELKAIAKPIGAAAGLLLLSATLTYLVVTGITEQMRPLPPLAEKEPSRTMDFPAKQEAIVVHPPVLSAKVVEVPPAAPVVRAAEIGQPQLRKLLQGKITTGFGWQQHPLYQDWRFHTGIDIAAETGQTIQAVSGGQIREVTRDAKLGLIVVVESGEYTFYYATLASAAVKPGATVKAGEIIGVAGESPAEPFTHLHFAVKKQDNYIDPQLLF